MEEPVTLEGDGKLLRIFIGENDRWEHKPLYEEIVRAARRQGLAGATVIRGIEGFGAKSHLHTTRILRLSEDLPLIVEIVDTQEKIEAFLQAIDHMITDGLATVERVDVRVYRAQPPADQ
jgi:PII-like signaling protein